MGIPTREDGMRMEHDQPTKYIINQELIEEMVRLNRQGRLTTEGMGGVLLDQQPDIEQIHDIIDIACGPGEWALRVAQEYPDKRVVGVDLSERMIAYAQAQADAANIAAQFRVMDVLKPLDFPDASFDLVNIRMIFAFMTPPHWPALLAECKRILRPGGIVRVTEVERTLTNNRTYERYTALWAQAFYRAHHSFSPDGQHYGQIAMLKRLLLLAGFSNVRHAGYFLDFSAGTEAHDGCFEDSLLVLKLGTPFLLKMGVTTQQEIDEIYEALEALQWQDDFCGYFPILTAWGKKA